MCCGKMEGTEELLRKGWIEQAAESELYWLVVFFFVVMVMEEICGASMRGLWDWIGAECSREKRRWSLHLC